MNGFQSLVVSFVLICSLGSIGCGNASSDRPSLAQVKGTVNYNGKPLPQGTIVFYPTEGRSAAGEIQEGKIFNVTTFEPGDGVPIGQHKVTIQAFDKPEADMYTPRKSVVPAKYTNIEQTPLTADIKAGDNDVTFDMTD